MKKFQKLSNGVEIPVFGLGTYKLSDDEVEDLVLKALDLGYRHIDTASFYQNEAGIGRALSQTDLAREDLFITSKCWQDEQGYEATKQAYQDSLDRLGLDYLDLYLIHWPDKNSPQAWRAMEELYEEGKVRAIGVSNFHKHHMEELLKTAKIKPMVNQYERHPYLQQDDLYDYSKKHGMKMEAWSPIARGLVFDDKTLQKIAQKHKKTVSQIVLRWHLQTDYIIFPKTSKVERLKENMAIFDFSLDDEDLALIKDLGKKNIRSGSNPDDFNL